MSLSLNQERTSTEAASVWHPARWPLYLRVLLGVIAGAAVGLIFGNREIACEWTNAHFAQIATLYIQVLPALATPLIFFAIVEAFVKTEITGRQGAKMFLICALNIAVAFFIGLVILNLLQPGRTWKGQLAAAAGTDTKDDGSETGPKAAPLPARAVLSFSPLEIIRSYVPKSIVQPFAENMVLTVAVLAILVGAALRSLKKTADAELFARRQAFGQA